MNRAAPQAFAAVDRRIDRGKTAERRHAQLEHFAAVAKSAFDGILGGYAEHLHPDALTALLREGSSRMKACTDGPGVASLLGDICKDLNGDLMGGKTSARAAAERAFKGEGA